MQQPRKDLEPPAPEPEPVPIAPADPAAEPVPEGAGDAQGETMQEDLPVGLTEAAESKPADEMLSEVIQEHFPDLHLEDWVQDLLRKVHVGTLHKMLEYATTRLKLRVCWISIWCRTALIVARRSNQ